MQYLLTSEEYEELSGRETMANSVAARRGIEILRAEVLEAMGVDCIHDGDGSGGRSMRRYCDLCPIVAIADRQGMGLAGRYQYLPVLCPHPKNFSK